MRKKLRLRERSALALTIRAHKTLYRAYSMLVKVCGIVHQGETLDEICELINGIEGNMDTLALEAYRYDLDR